MSDNDILAGRLAVITGGSSGIGAATARRLADAGADVIIGYHHSEERAEALRSSLPRGLHEIARLSLADPESFKALSAHIASDPVGLSAVRCGLIAPMNDSLSQEARRH